MNFKYIIQRRRTAVNISGDFEKLRGFLKKLRANMPGHVPLLCYKTGEECVFISVPEEGYRKILNINNKRKLQVQVGHVHGMLYAVWAIPTALLFLGIGAVISRRVFAKHQVS